jgi:hypothetical protein
MRFSRGALFCLLVVGHVSLGNVEAFAQWNLFGGGGSQGNHGHQNHSHYEGGHRHQSDIGTDITRMIIGGVDAAIRNGANNPQPRYNNNDNYYDDYDYQPRYQTVRPQYKAAPKPKPVTVKANKKPAEKLMTPHSNPAPADSSFAVLEEETTRLAQDAVEEKAKDSFTELVEKLGEAGHDPKVDEKVKELAKKIRDGEAITQDDMDELLADAKATGKLPAGSDDKELENMADNTKELSEANEILVAAVDAYSNGNGNGVIPTGQIDVVFMPAWPADEVVILADGSIMAGTGGQGSVQTASTDAQVLLEVPVGVGEPEPNSSGDVAKRVRDGVLLMNPESTGATIEYVVSNNNYSMQPGFTQRLAEGRTWVVTFDRGEGFGQASYSLTEGTYAFGPSDRGWELYAQKFSVTIDNVEGEEDFYFNIDNAQHTLHAGDAKTFKSNYPIYVRFDRGNGELAQKTINEKSLTLQVAVNPNDSYWDLYPIESDLKVVNGSSKRPSAKSEKKSSRTERLQKLLRLSNL